MRPALRALVILLLAAATTVAVAWAGIVNGGRQPAYEEVMAGIRADSEPNWLRPPAAPDPLPQPPADVQSVLLVYRPLEVPSFLRCTGWPRPAMSSIWSFNGLDGREAAKAWSASWDGGWEVPNPFFFPVAVRGPAPRPRTLALPLRPVWPGFAVNTAAYASAWWLVLVGVPFARAALRRRRGRCPRCSYDRAGLAEGTACPECGSALATTGT